MWEDDAHKVAIAMQRDLKDRPEPDWSIASESPPVRVIDCVLSLRKPYKTVVLPRVTGFRSAHPNVTTLQSLLELIDTVGGPIPFIKTELRMDSPSKGEAIVAVAQYLNDMQKRFPGDDESTRMHAWAEWARPGDYLAIEVRGFALAGFQYLRMLFGADTAKPDVHITRYVSEAIGREVKEVHALYILERAAEIAGQSLRRLDNLIWELRAGA
jgi:hypothetical protein